MSNVPAVITGVGPVSAIGCGREAFWSALTAGRPGFGPITLCDASKSPSRIAAEVKDFDLEEYVDRGGVLARHAERLSRCWVPGAACLVRVRGAVVLVRGAAVLVPGCGTPRPTLASG